MFKALKRIGKDKTIFDVEIKPISVSIYTNQPFNFKLQVQRGKQQPDETKPIKVERSMKNTDIKTAHFTESFTVPCTYFVKDGVPEQKTCTISILKLFPGGNEVVIAKTEVNLSNHFGQAFQRQTLELEATKQAQGSIVRSLELEAIITLQNQKDKAVYDQCVEWRQLAAEQDQGVQAARTAATAAASFSQVNVLDGEDSMNDFNAGQNNLRTQSMAVIPGGANSFFQDGQPESAAQRDARQTTSGEVQPGAKRAAVAGFAKSLVSWSAEDPAKQQYEKEMKTRQLTLMKDTDTKRQKIEELQTMLKQLEDENFALKARVHEKQAKTEKMKQTADQYNHDQAEFKDIKRSTILKKDFYEAEPDHYVSDQINF